MGELDTSDYERKFLLAGQPSVISLSEVAYIKAVKQLKEPISLGMNDLVEIDLETAKPVAVEGSNTCLLGYLKYGTKMWIWHAVPSFIDTIASQLSTRLRNQVSGGEMYLDLFGFSPLSEELIKDLRLDYDVYIQTVQERRESIPSAIKKAAGNKATIIVRSHCVNESNVKTHSFLIPEENEISFVSKEI